MFIIYIFRFGSKTDELNADNNKNNIINNRMLIKQLELKANLQLYLQNLRRLLRTITTRIQGKI